MSWYSPEERGKPPTNRGQVYLAKSNKANPDDVFAVRTLLKKYDLKVEEFEGGDYSNKPLLESDLLIIIPNLTEYDACEMFVPLGKGLHKQIEDYQCYRDEDKVLVVINTDGGIAVCNIETLSVEDCEDWVNYSIAYLEEGEPSSIGDVSSDMYEEVDSEQHYLNKILDINYDVKKGISSIDNDNLMLLLIKKYK